MYNVLQTNFPQFALVKRFMHQINYYQQRTSIYDMATANV